MQCMPLCHLPCAVNTLHLLLYVGQWCSFITYLKCPRISCIVYVQLLTSVESYFDAIFFFCSRLCEIVANQPILSLWLAIYMYGCCPSTYYWLCIWCIVLHLHWFYLTGGLHSKKIIFFCAEQCCGWWFYSVFLFTACHIT